MDKLPAPALPGMAATGNVTKLINSFDVDVYGFEDVALDRLPNAEERRILQERFRDLGILLRGMDQATEDQKRASQALALLFATIPSLRNVNTIDMIGAYLLTLNYLPSAAVTQACKELAGDQAKSDFIDGAPTAARIAHEAKRIMTPLAAEKNKIEQLLTARKLIRAHVAPEDQARIRAGLRDLAERMQDQDREQRQRISAKVAADQSAWHRSRTLAHYRAMGIEPRMTGNILIEPELLENLGKLKGVTDGSAARRSQSARGRGRTARGE